MSIYILWIPLEQSGSKMYLRYNNRMSIARYIEESKKLPSVNQEVLAIFIEKLRHPPYTRDEGAPDHYTAYLVPFHKPTKSIFAGNHKKSGFWIPPGGHIDCGETPVKTAVRECKEELSYEITPHMTSFFNISSIEIHNRKECTRHLEFWFRIDMPEQIDFNFDRREFYEARWFTIPTFLKKHTYQAVKDGVKILP